MGKNLKSTHKRLQALPTGGWKKRTQDS